MAQVFISHSSHDKAAYVFPIAKALKAQGITYWLDSEQIQWGGDVPMSLHQGLQKSKYVLACLSESSIGSAWVRDELSTALAQQITSDTVRVLPLILNAKERILKEYPIVAKHYLEFDRESPQSIASKIASLEGIASAKSKAVNVKIEGEGSGEIFEFVLPVDSSIEYCLKDATYTLQLKTSFNVSAMAPLQIRWVLVEKQVIQEWRHLPIEHVVKHVLVTRGDDDKLIATSDPKRKLRDFVRLDHTYFLMPIQRGLNDRGLGLEMAPYNCSE